MKRVVIDTDYFKFITKDLTDDTFFLKLMQELDYEPVMHEYVYKEELHEHSLVKKLVSDGKLIVFSYNTLTVEKTDKKDYENLFYMAYLEMNGTKFISNRTINDYHHEKENLGEIHSVILAKILGYDLMMSNDGGAKTFVHTKLNTSKNRIRVINIEETFTELLSPNTSGITWSEIRTIMRPLDKSDFKTDKAKFQRVRDIWVNNASKE